MSGGIHMPEPDMPLVNEAKAYLEKRSAEGRTELDWLIRAPIGATFSIGDVTAQMFFGLTENQIRNAIEREWIQGVYQLAPKAPIRISRDGLLVYAYRVITGAGHSQTA